MGSDYLSNPLVFDPGSFRALYPSGHAAFSAAVDAGGFLQSGISNHRQSDISAAESTSARSTRFAGIDLAAIVLMWLVQSLELALIVMISGMGSNLAATLAWAIPELVNLALNVFLFAILIQVILSWVSPGTYNPALSLIHSLTEPVLRPAQRLIPPISGLDLSPMVVMVGLTLLKMLLLPPLQMLTGTPFR